MHLQKYTQRDAHLPRHHQGTSNRLWRVLGHIDGHRSSLGAHADPEQETAEEQLRPRLGERRADDREGTEDGCKKDAAAAAEVEVQGVGEPAAAFFVEWLGKPLGSGLGRWGLTSNQQISTEPH
jgi:hypothetical protein